MSNDNDISTCMFTFQVHDGGTYLDFKYTGSLTYFGQEKILDEIAKSVYEHFKTEMIKHGLLKEVSSFNFQ